MINSIDTAWFLPFCIPLLIFLALFSLIKIFPSINTYYIKLLDKLNILLPKNEKLKDLLSKLWNSLLQNANFSWRFLIKNLSVISSQFKKIDSFISTKDTIIIGEPVNYFSLTLRKLFDTSVHTWIVYTAALIMLFYFILTIF